MLLRPFLMLARGRLILVAVISMLFVLFVFSATAAERITDIGIYWHYFCGCAPDAEDTRRLLDIWSFLYLYLGGVLGLTMAPGINAPGMSAGGMGGGWPLAVGDTRFLLTRPIPRNSVLLRPLAIATAALAFIPALCILLLLGWLRLVHAPSLGYLVALLKLVPSTYSLGPHPSLFGLLAASHFLRFYIAGFSIGLCSYSVLTAHRWLNFSSNTKLRGLSVLPFVAIFSVPLLIHSKALLSAVLLLPQRGFSLDFQPTIFSITLHFFFAAAVIYGTWKLLQHTEL